VLDFLPDQWKGIDKLINKFLWNKNFNARNAPHRIRKDIVYKNKLNGGLGMIQLSHIATAIKVKRYSILQDGYDHPVALLQGCLGANEHLRQSPKLDIDYVTSIAMGAIYKNNKEAYSTFRLDLLAADRLTQNRLLSTKILNVIRPIMINSIEHLTLRRARIFIIRDLLDQPAFVTSFLRICDNYLHDTCRMLFRLLADDVLPNDIPNARQYLYDIQHARWVPLNIAKSAAIRLTLFREDIITNTKLMNLSENDARILFHKIHKIGNVQNRTKLLRLLYGDVYCNARAFRFGLTTNDRCIRCFETGTIQHLLLYCPYTVEVWDRLGIRHETPGDIINPDISTSDLEIRAELISEIVFRQQQIPPSVLILKTYTTFSKGLSRNKILTRQATDSLNFYNITGNWTW
jgi:hypothetical protein